MNIAHQFQLIDYCFNHPGTEEHLKSWFYSVKAQQWESFEDIVKTFPNTQRMDDDTVSFKILEDRCYVVASVKFSAKIIVIRSIRSHKPVDLMLLTERLFSTCH